MYFLLKQSLLRGHVSFQGFFIPSGGSLDGDELYGIPIHKKSPEKHMEIFFSHKDFIHPKWSFAECGLPINCVVTTNPSLNKLRKFTQWMRTN